MFNYSLSYCIDVNPSSMTWFHLQSGQNKVLQRELKCKYISQVLPEQFPVELLSNRNQYNSGPTNHNRHILRSTEVQCISKNSNFFACANRGNMFASNHRRFGQLAAFRASMGTFGSCYFREFTVCHK